MTTEYAEPVTPSRADTTLAVLLASRLFDRVDYCQIDSQQCELCGDVDAATSVQIYERDGSTWLLRQAACDACAFYAATEVYDTTDNDLYAEVDPMVARRHGIEPPAVNR